MSATACPLCGRAAALHDDSAILDAGVPPLSCENCFWEGTRDELIARVEAAAMQFARDHPALRDGTGATRERLRRIFTALLRSALDPLDVERLAPAIGRLAGVHDATSRAVLDDAARDEAERVRRLRELGRRSA